MASGVLLTKCAPTGKCDLDSGAAVCQPSNSGALEVQQGIDLRGSEGLEFRETRR